MQFFRSQSVNGTKLNGKPPAVVLFTLRQVVENLEDLRITEGVANALWASVPLEGSQGGCK